MDLTIYSSHCYHRPQFIQPVNLPKKPVCAFALSGFSTGCTPALPGDIYYVPVYMFVRKCAWVFFERVPVFWGLFCNCFWQKPIVSITGFGKTVWSPPLILYCYQQTSYLRQSVGIIFHISWDQQLYVRSGQIWKSKTTAWPTRLVKDRIFLRVQIWLVLRCTLGSRQCGRVLFVSVANSV